jgi:four helix bundle protein
MVRKYPVVLDTMRSLRPLLVQLERRDADLARQMRRAAASVALNLGEGMYSRGKNRAARYHTALGSARETLACVEVAAALHGIAADEALVRQLDVVIGTLVRLVA